jgi:hypothetical protein
VARCSWLSPPPMLWTGGAGAVGRVHGPSGGPVTHPKGVSNLGPLLWSDGARMIGAVSHRRTRCTWPVPWPAATQRGSASLERRFQPCWVDPRAQKWRARDRELDEVKKEGQGARQAMAPAATPLTIGQSSLVRWFLAPKKETRARGGRGLYCGFDWEVCDVRRCSEVDQWCNKPRWR